MDSVAGQNIKKSAHYRDPSQTKNTVTDAFSSPSFT